VTAALYILACLTTLLCAVLLLRGFFRVRRKLLLWSGLCFAILTISNLFKIADLLIFPDIDLYSYRIGSAALAMALLIYGLVWESQ
jgi:energy-converting hydrogenase Eha subunit G